MATQINTLNDLLSENISILKSAELNIQSALPNLANASVDPQLKNSFSLLTTYIDSWIYDLDTVIMKLRLEARQEPAKSIDGILGEATSLLDKRIPTADIDVAILLYLQTIISYLLIRYSYISNLVALFPDSAEVVQLLITPYKKLEEMNTELNTLAGNQFQRVTSAQVSYQSSEPMGLHQLEQNIQQQKQELQQLPTEPIETQRQRLNELKTQVGSQEQQIQSVQQTATKSQQIEQERASIQSELSEQEKKLQELKQNPSKNQGLKGKAQQVLDKLSK